MRLSQLYGDRLPPFIPVILRPESAGIPRPGPGDPKQLYIMACWGVLIDNATEMGGKVIAKISTARIAKVIGLARHTVAPCLKFLIGKGLLKRSSRGCFEIIIKAKDKPNPVVENDHSKPHREWSETTIRGGEMLGTDSDGRVVENDHSEWSKTTIRVVENDHPIHYPEMTDTSEIPTPPPSSALEFAYADARAEGPSGGGGVGDFPEEQPQPQSAGNSALQEDAWTQTDPPQRSSPDRSDSPMSRPSGQPPERPGEAGPETRRSSLGASRSSGEPGFTGASTSTTATGSAKGSRPTTDTERQRWEAQRRVAAAASESAVGTVGWSYSPPTLEDALAELLPALSGPQGSTALNFPRSAASGNGSSEPLASPTPGTSSTADASTPAPIPPSGSSPQSSRISVSAPGTRPSRSSATQEKAEWENWKRLRASKREKA